MAKVELTLKDVQVVKLTQTLKARDTVWGEGTVFDRRESPFPPDIGNEVNAFLKGRSNAIEIVMTSMDAAAEDEKMNALQIEKNEALELAKAEAAKVFEAAEREKEQADIIETLNRDLEKYGEKIKVLEDELASATDELKTIKVIHAEEIKSHNAGAKGKK